MNLNKKNLWKPMEPNKVKRRYWTAAGAAVLCLCCVTPAMAAGGDPLDIVNNLSDFIFSIIKALGVIILGWGIFQMSQKALRLNTKAVVKAADIFNTSMQMEPRFCLIYLKYLTVMNILLIPKMLN